MSATWEPGDGVELEGWTTSRRLAASRVGRYALLRKVGCGGMGVVHVAYDDALDRMVAIKFIHEKRAKSTKARERLIREAKAMARLSHPSVVHVYDVGQHEGRLYIAMEYVEGETLTDWLSCRARSWTEVVRVFLSVGEGLAAAHRAGVVHRDFKPDNVLIDQEGRAKVADFGLAGVDWELEDTVPTGDTASLPLTATGALLGTPAYMAPEQHRCESCSAASDQFSFCVAMYEAIYGERPFFGESAEELAASVSRGPSGIRPRRREIPRRVHGVIARGLQPDPIERYESMDGLLTALRRTVAPRRRPALIAAFGVVAGLGGAAGLLGVNERCGDVERSLEEVWNDGARQRAASAFATTRLQYAPKIWDKVEDRIDTFALRWTRLQRQACEARSEAGPATPVRDAQTQCLRQALIALEERVKILESADGQTVDRSMDLVTALPDLSDCADPRILATSTRSTPPLDQADRVEALTRRLAEARAVADAGGVIPALELGREVLADAETLGFTPLVAHARRHVARLAQESGEFVEAAGLFERAYLEALAAGDDDEALEALIDGVFTRALRLDDATGALERVKLAEAIAQRIGATGTRQEARLQAAIAWAHTSDGRLGEAVEHMQRALEITEGIDGPGRLSSASYHRGLAVLLGQLGRHDEALAQAREEMRILEATLGRQHPDTVSALRGLAEALMDLGRHEEARPHLEEVVQSQRARSVNTAQLARSLSLVARVRAETGALDAAVLPMREALLLMEDRFGPEDPHVASHRTNLGELLRRQGQPEQALEHHERALSALEAAYAPEDLRVTGTLVHLARALIDLDRHREARQPLRRALRIRVEHVGSTHPDVTEVLDLMGEVEALQQAASSAP